MPQQPVKIYPSIRIEGDWLTEAGFKPGATVYLFVESGKIIIKLEPENSTEANTMKLFDALNSTAV